MNTNINIIPFPVTCATRAQIGDVKVNLELGKVSIPVNLYGEDGSLLKTEYVELTGIEYDLWLKDDYLIEKALAKLGLVRVGSEVKAPEVVIPTPEASQAAQDIASDAVSQVKDEAAKTDASQGDNAQKQSEDNAEVKKDVKKK